MEENETQTPATADNQQQAVGQVSIQNIYTKDISFETPNTPHIFMEMSQNKPAMEHRFSSGLKKLGDNVYEVVLGATITAKIGDKTAFLVELQQAGIFTMSGFTQEQVNALASTFCLNTLFPYVRETVSQLVIKGGFPPLYLPPINFDVRQQQQGGQNGEAPAAPPQAPTGE